METKTFGFDFIDFDFYDQRFSFPKRRLYYTHQPNGNFIPHMKDYFSSYLYKHTREYRIINFNITNKNISSNECEKNSIELTTAGIY